MASRAWWLQFARQWRGRDHPAPRARTGL